VAPDVVFDGGVLAVADFHTSGGTGTSGGGTPTTGGTDTSTAGGSLASTGVTVVSAAALAAALVGAGWAAYRRGRRPADSTS
jgi:hypothetical protein